MLGLDQYITVDHFEAISKILLFTSLIISVTYVTEYFLAFYSGNPFEIAQYMYRLTGDYSFLFGIMVLCNCLIPLTLCFKKLRRNLGFLFVVAIMVNIGMWVERFVLIVASLAHDFDPYAWGTYTPSFVEIGITIGSFGLFFLLFLLFSRTLPVLSITELKEHQ